MKLNRILLFVLLPIIFLALLYLNGTIGVSKSQIEKQARMTLSVDPSWDSVIATGNGLSGMLFYDKTHSDYQYVIYSKRPNTFGYVFASGGCTQLERKGVVKYYRNSSEEAVYLSMNQQQVSRVRLNHGDNVELELDHTKPFAFILPSDIKDLSFYDIDGKSVEIFTDRY